MEKATKKGGFIISAELVLIATIMVLGLLVGMLTIRDTMIAELADVGHAFGSLNQSYSFDGVELKQTKKNKGSAVMSGSDFSDSRDPSDDSESDISVTIAPQPENRNR